MASCSNDLEFYDPIGDKTSTKDPQKLAVVLKDTDSSTLLDERECCEAIVVCFDQSNSMRSAAFDDIDGPSRGMNQDKVSDEAGGGEDDGSGSTVNKIAALDAIFELRRVRSSVLGPVLREMLSSGSLSSDSALSTVAILNYPEDAWYTRMLQQHRQLCIDFLRSRDSEVVSRWPQTLDPGTFDANVFLHLPFGPAQAFKVKLSPTMTAMRAKGVIEDALISKNTLLSRSKMILCGKPDFVQILDGDKHLGSYGVPETREVHVKKRGNLPQWGYTHLKASKEHPASQCGYKIVVPRRRGAAIAVDCKGDETLFWLLAKIWRQNKSTNPFTRTIWVGLRDDGDGLQVGTLAYSQYDARLQDSVMSLLNAYSPDDDKGRHLKKTVQIQLQGPQSDPRKASQVLSRMTGCKQLFHAFINRSQVGVGNHGLVGSHTFSILKSSNGAMAAKS